MIRVLANSIQEVNESKMSFYKINHQNIPRLIEDVKTIESSLILIKSLIILCCQVGKRFQENFFKRLIRKK
ncbi:heptaprenyl diphosphate synthase component 1 [Anaerobacillus sp. HL2]|nr:heptaprenyl diphosphate synthase component 1 [Anaerobacillus sp. HL2]